MPQQQFESRRRRRATPRRRRRASAPSPADRVGDRVGEIGDRERLARAGAEPPWPGQVPGDDRIALAARAGTTFSHRIVEVPSDGPSTQQRRARRADGLGEREGGDGHSRLLRHAARGGQCIIDEVARRGRCSSPGSSRRSRRRRPSGFGQRAARARARSPPADACGDECRRRASRPMQRCRARSTVARSR